MNHTLLACLWMSITLTEQFSLRITLRTKSTADYHCIEVGQNMTHLVRKEAGSVIQSVAYLYTIAVRWVP